MKRLFVLICAAALASLMPVWSEGSDSVYDLSSPSFLGGGWSFTSQESPQADGINPAASARNQRVTLDLSYIGLGLDDTLSGWSGLVLNAGMSIPTRAGVVSFAGNFRHSPDWETVNLGTQLDLKASFAKEIYDGYLAGLGLNASVGDGQAYTADLGIIHPVGTWKGLKNFRWALVLQELGYVDKTADYPAPFSLGAGAAFTPLSTTSLRLDIKSDITFPTFQNVRMVWGADFVFRDRLGLQLGLRMDAAEILDGDYSGLIPSFGLYYNYRTSIPEEKLSSGMVEKGWNQSDIHINAAAAPMGNGLWAIGGGLNVPLGVIDRKAPVIDLEMGGFRFNPDAGTSPAPEGEGDTGTAPDGAGAEAGIPSGDSPAVSWGTRSGGKGAEKGAPDHAVASARAGSGVKGRKGGPEVLTVQETAPEPEKGLVKDPSEAAAVPVVDYISPNNDGKYDDLEFPIKISDSRYIQGFALVIQDGDGNIVRKLENKEERPENAGFTGFFKRLFSVKKGLTIPESLRWDGLTQGGTVAEDGKYIFYIQAWDDNGNQGYSRPLAIVVDNTPPALELNPPQGLDLIFSPDGDGNKDQLSVGISGSSEDLWEMDIYSSAGKKVRTYTWKNRPIGNVVWDGKDDQGSVVPDDVYYSQIRSTDRAGNSTQGGFENIIINTIPTPVGLTISSRFFSPGNARAIPSVEFALNIPVRTGILKWSLEVKGAGERVYRTFAGGDPPETIVFQGKTDQGGMIPEGTYKAVLSLEYSNGSRPGAVSPEFIADTTAPQVNVTVSYPSFSPNGDDQKDTIKFYQETSLEDQWMGTILDSTGNVVASFNWIEKADDLLEWTGHTAGGTLAADGSYSYVLSATDRAGNTGTSRPVAFELDTEDTSVLLSTGTDAFSPNGDRVKDTISLIPELRVPQGIEKYILKIEDESGKAVREYTGTGTLNRNLSWDGLTQEGRKAEDQSYRARLQVVYDKGDISEAVSRWFVLDTGFPKIEVSSSYGLFSPEGDGQRDSVQIRQTASPETLWTGTIRNEKGETVREYFWKDSAGDFEWDGKDGDGNALPDGKYSYSVASEDRAGNRTISPVQEFVVDTTSRVVYITAERDGFSPNGNGKFEDLLFNVLIPNKNGISGWEMVISNAQGQAVKTFTADVIPERIVWDGKNDQNARVADGRYTARLNVRYLKGNIPTSVTQPFLLDTQAPAVNFTMQPVPFSPDNDGVDDEIRLSPSITDMTGVESWSLMVFDRTGKLFRTFKGTGSPAGTIQWDGRGDNGELVISAEDYPYQLSASDKWGNLSEKQGIIPVDVLVVREGNRLKIQIASIQFAPDSPKLSEESQEIIDRNISVIRRLSEILKKYESYKITIEGHAASVYWNNPARAQREETEELQPLSKARAETVKAYLVQMGIDPARMQTLGRGGTAPVVPHSDIENRWKNRRVEFLLDK